MINRISYKNCTVWIGLLLMIIGCEVKKSELEDRFRENMVSAGKNRKELEKVVAHYQQNPRDSLKLKSAIFLIGNMENHVHYEGEWLTEYDKIFNLTASLDNDGISRANDSMVEVLGQINWAAIFIREDLKTLSADYLIENIDQAYEAWQNAPWVSEVSFDVFCNYILPYNSYYESPEKWRTRMRDRYQYILDDPEIPKTIVDVCCALVDEEKTWFRWTGDLNAYPSAISLSNLLKGHRGSCADMSNLAAYGAKALGIPVAMDYVHRWGNGGTHGWSALIVSDSTFLPFMGAESRPGDFEWIREREYKPAKVFRHSMSYVESSFAARARMAGIKKIPPNLSDPRDIDVTSYYNTTSDLTLDVQGKNGTGVYLCIFQRGGWDAVEGGIIEDNRVSFKQVGRDIIYMPMYYKYYDYQPAAPPLWLPIQGEYKSIVAHEEVKTTMKVFRKFPLRRLGMRSSARQLTGLRFEGSDSPEFKNPTLLYTAPPPIRENYIMKYTNGYPIRDRMEYETLWEEMGRNGNKNFRYVRLIADQDKPFKLGELQFFSGKDSIPLSGKPLGSLPNPEWAFDGLPGFSIINEDQLDTAQWVGLDLGQSTAISRIRYLPANNEHTVQPGKTYELFYWKDKWISLGIQKAERHFLEFKEVPSGGLYWVLCKDCESKQARTFTYENNKQLWW